MIFHSCTCLSIYCICRLIHSASCSMTISMFTSLYNHICVDLYVYYAIIYVCSIHLHRGWSTWHNSQICSRKPPSMLGLFFIPQHNTWELRHLITHFDAGNRFMSSRCYWIMADLILCSLPNSNLNLCEVEQGSKGSRWSCTLFNKGGFHHGWYPKNPKNPWKRRPFNFNPSKNTPNLCDRLRDLRLASWGEPAEMDGLDKWCSRSTCETSR